MNERIAQELELLKAVYPKLSYRDEGQWVLIEEYPILPGLPWNRQVTNICFQIPTGYPGAPPYGFYVPEKILCGGTRPTNAYVEPASSAPPFSGVWGFFSWQHDNSWRPTANIQNGSNLLNFSRTFKDRFIEGT